MSLSTTPQKDTENDQNHQEQMETDSVEAQPNDDRLKKDSAEGEPKKVESSNSVEETGNDRSLDTAEKKTDVEEVTKSGSNNSEEGKDEEDKIDSKKGLYDKPLVIEGKRERHTVNRLVTAPTPVKKSFQEVSGCGVPLGDIEYANTALSKVYSETLKPLHRLCYGTTGAATTRKKDIRKFNGFPFEVDSPEFEKKKAMAMKLNSAEVRDIRRILGSESGQTKADAVMNILKFLQKPRDLGLKVPSAKKRKRSAKSIKRTKKAGSKKTEKSSVTVGETDEDESKDDDGDVQTAVEVPEKKPAKSVASKKKPIKRSAGIKLKKPAEKSTNPSNVASHSKEVVNWGPTGPTDAELNNAISELLHSVDLVHCTMKQMCQRISEKFPNLDVVKHKSALKDRVKEALERM